MLILEVKWLSVSPCTSNIPNISTVKPGSTDTRLIRTAGYYGQFRLCQVCVFIKLLHLPTSREAACLGGSFIILYNLSVQ